MLIQNSIFCLDGVSEIALSFEIECYDGCHPLDAIKTSQTLRRLRQRSQGNQQRLTHLHIRGISEAYDVSGNGLAGERTQISDSYVRHLESLATASMMPLSKRSRLHPSLILTFRSISY